MTTLLNTFLTRSQTATQTYPYLFRVLQAPEITMKRPMSHLWSIDTSRGIPWLQLLRNNHGIIFPCQSKTCSSSLQMHSLGRTFIPGNVNLSLMSDSSRCSIWHQDLTIASRRSRVRWQDGLKTLWSEAMSHRDVLMSIWPKNTMNLTNEVIRSTIWHPTKSKDSIWTSTSSKKRR